MAGAALIDYYQRVHFPWLDAGDTHTVLGYRLHPMTLWHVRELERAQLFTGQSPTDGCLGLLAAVEVCAMRPFGRRMHPLRRQWRRLRAQRFFARYETEHYIRWGAYLGEYGPTAGPILLPGPPDKMRPVKTPGWLYMTAVLMALGHMTERQAWCTELRRARWYMEALNEARGGEAVCLLSAGEVESMPEDVWRELR